MVSNEAMPNFEVNEWTLPTDITLMDAAIGSFTGTLIAAGWEKDSDDLTDAQVGFRELLANAIAHGNLGVERPKGCEDTLTQLALKEQAKHPGKKQKKVFVTIKANKHELIITIRDEGNGFIRADVPNPLHPDNIMKPSGRGIFNMLNFHGFKSVEHTEGGREVMAIKVIGPKE